MTTLLPAQRASLRNLHRNHKGDTMIVCTVPIHTDLDPAPMPGWYVQRQLETALAQARQEEQQTMTAPTAAQHTPGPWATSAAYKRTDISYVSAADNLAIAECCNDAHQANALLIAAAPELLAAMVELFKQCAMIHKYGGDSYNGKEADAAILAARAAIVKATEPPA